MAVILSLETSTDVCSAAFHRKGELVAEREIHQPQIHAARLVPLINELSLDSGIALREVAAVAVTSGPGSYTGLRIGTSTAKGLCYGLDIPLIAIGTLELLTSQGAALSRRARLLCPMIDARRMEVYCQVSDRHGNLLQPVTACVVDESSFSELLSSGEVLFFGNGAAKCREVIKHRNAVFVEDVYPRAAAMGSIAEKRFRAGSFESLVNFIPFYLKEFIAGKARSGA